MEPVAIAKFVDNEPLTVPVTDEVLRVIQEWTYDHGDDLNERLKPFGLNKYSIVAPEYRRVVTPEELV